MSFQLFILSFIAFLPIFRSVCIESKCPYQCCIDNDSCNTRPDCLLEDKQYCMWSSDCLSGCCHGKLCHPSKDCDDYQMITGLVLGFFYLLLFCCTMSYCYSLVRRRRIKQNITSNRKVNVIYEGFLAKNLAKMVAGPAFLKNEAGEGKGTENLKKMMVSGGSPEEKWNLNLGEEERPNPVLNESPMKKKFNYEEP